MTRTELHELLDIVMDARDRTDRDLEIQIGQNVTMINWDSLSLGSIHSSDYPTFSDFTQAVKEYIQSLG